MDLTEAIVIIVVLIALTVLFHYQGLWYLSEWISKRHGGARQNLLIINFVVILLHLVEIAVYGVGYWVGDIAVNIGDFVGRAVGFRDYLYFSAETFTTLGLGDIYPNGDLRMIASIESLNGVILLGWSASYTFLAMQRYWNLRRQHEKAAVTSQSGNQG